MSNNKPIVFVPQYVRNLDFAEAESFGEVKFLTTLEYRPEPTVAKFNDQIVTDIRNGLVDYVAGTDFIMTTGSSMPNVIVGTMLRPGEHNVLKWSNRRTTYELFKLRV